MSSTCAPVPSRRKINEVTPYRALSADVWFVGVKADLATVFVDCLAQLPNLRTLEIPIVNRVNTVKQELKRECAQFPSIRELWICDELVEFVGNCQNLESVTVVGASLRSAEILHFRGKRLRHVAGVHKDHIQSGELRVPFRSGAFIHQEHCYGSCGGLSRPPGDLY